eukprot:5558019-Pyramimonas_sp.AAC.1
MCQYCGDDVGDLHHRFWRCPRCADMRAAAVEDVIVDMAKEASPNDLFYTKALLPRAVLPDIPPPLDTQRWWYCMGGQDMDITGEVFTDGSA